MNIYKLLSLLFIPMFAFVGADTECKYAPSSNSGTQTQTLDRRSNPNTFRLVQYNVEWLFIDQYNGCPGSSCSWSNQSEAQTHLNWVSTVINDLKPDYINFCEIEGCDELNMLKDKTSNEYNPYLIKGTDSSTGQNVGVLTKIDPLTDLARNEERAEYPIAGSDCGYTGSSGTSGVSKHYYTTYNISNHNVAIIGAHLLAFPTDPSRCASREAQAQVLQDTIYSLYKKNYEIIVMGDLNDFDGSVLDINSNKPTSHVLDILKGYLGNYAGMYNLKSVSEKISQSDRYSDWYDSNSNCKQDKSDLSMIDHILVTSKLYNLIDNVFPYHNYQEYCGTYNSDHWPVVVDFKFS